MRQFRGDAIFLEAIHFLAFGRRLAIGRAIDCTFHLSRVETTRIRQGVRADTSIRATVRIP